MFLLKSPNMSIKFQHLLEKIPHMWYYEIYNGGRKWTMKL